MKITAITAPSGTDFGLNAAFKIICDTLTELGEDVTIINLASAALPYYDGGNSAFVYKIMETLQEADGVVFAAPVFFSTPCAIFQSFLEYFADESHRRLLEEKSCMLMAISENGGERRALETMSDAVNQLGAFDVVRIGLNSSAASVVKAHVIDLIERQSEDFYRILRQGRKYVLPNAQGGPPNLDLEFAQPAAAANKVSPVKIEELYKKHDLSNISAHAQEDIKKITNLFAQKYVSTDDSLMEEGGKASGLVAIAAPRASSDGVSTCKQLTASLPHYFNTHLARDVIATIQLDITGKGGFNGYLSIVGTNCDFHEGIPEKSDIIVLAEAKTWIEVLRKKISAQRAFMMGQLKVRGNFVLLTKFDQLFNEII